MAPVGPLIISDGLYEKPLFICVEIYLASHTAIDADARLLSSVPSLAPAQDGLKGEGAGRTELHAHPALYAA